MRALVVMIGLLSLAAPAKAGSPVGYGFRAGFSTSDIHGTNAEAFGPATHHATAVSIFARIPLAGPLSIQPELGWVSKGGGHGTSDTLLDPSQISTTSVATRLDYVVVPVLVRLDISTPWFFEPHVFGGPEVGFRARENREYSAWSWDTAHSTISEKVVSTRPQVRDVDWTLTVGGGVTLGHDRRRVVIETRYSAGAVSIDPNAERSFAYNRAWITTFGIEWR